MNESINAFPLHWPIDWPRTKSRTRPPYRVSFGRARDDVIWQLRQMSVPDWEVVISSNIPLRRDGLPVANAGRLADPGIAVYFVRKKQRQVVACDKWDTVDGNMRAINITIESLRSIERAGASELLERAFTGFKALPAPGEGTSGGWWQVLGVEATAPMEVVKAAYRKLAGELHPDKGGDAGAMAMVNRAWEQAMAARS